MQSPQEGRAFEQLRKVVAGHGGSVHMTTKLSAITPRQGGRVRDR